MRIIVSKDGKGAQPIDATTWADEAELQRYIADNPNVLPLSDVKDDLQLLTVRKEFPLSGGERIDVLAIDRDGDVYVIETKMFTGADKRRVIAQVLDYGAALWKGYGDGEAFVRDVDAWLGQGGGPSLREALRDTFGLEDDEIEDTVASLARNAAGGRFKFVILMDRLSERLRDLVLFVNEKSAFDIYAVEMELYRHQGLEIVIPRLFGATIRKEAALGGSPRGPKSDEPSFLTAVKNLPPEIGDAVRKVYFASKKWSDDLKFGHGSINPRFYHASQKSFYTLRPSGSLTINLQWHDRANAGEKAAKFRDRFRRRLNDAGFVVPDEPHPGLAPSTWASKADEFVHVVQEVLAQRP
jgi:hypothetical protein